MAIDKMSVYERYFYGEDIDRFYPDRPFERTLPPQKNNRSFIVEVPEGFDHLSPSEEDIAFIEFHLNQRTKHELIYTSKSIRLPGAA